ncbi:MAG: hypothetical protein M0Q92_06195 [Methanoregula sp.]|nr:hypothetical protein [Methanoregula sp.]
MLFIVCLAIAGSVVAGAYYFAVDLPQQQNGPLPENSFDIKSDCNTCKSNCSLANDYYACMSECDLLVCGKGPTASTKTRDHEPETTTNIPESSRAKAPVFCDPVAPSCIG